MLTHAIRNHSHHETVHIFIPKNYTGNGGSGILFFKGIKNKKIKSICVFSLICPLSRLLAVAAMVAYCLSCVLSCDCQECGEGRQEVNVNRENDLIRFGFFFLKKEDDDDGDCTQQFNLLSSVSHYNLPFFTMSYFLKEKEGEQKFKTFITDFVSIDRY